MMEKMLSYLSQMVWAMVWYFNKRDERRFCKRENREANENYLRLVKEEKILNKSVTKN